MGPSPPLWKRGWQSGQRFHPASHLLLPTVSLRLTLRLFVHSGASLLVSAAPDPLPQRPYRGEPDPWRRVSDGGQNAEPDPESLPVLHIPTHWRGSLSSGTDASGSGAEGWSPACQIRGTLPALQPPAANLFGEPAAQDAHPPPPQSCARLQTGLVLHGHRKGLEHASGGWDLMLRGEGGGQEGGEEGGGGGGS